MNEIFKGIKVDDKVFSYYYQIWGKVMGCGPTKFVVSYMPDTGEEASHVYDYYGGSGWLSGYRIQEVFAEEIPALPADDLSNLVEGDKVFVQPHQEWGEVTEVLPKDRAIVIIVPRDRLGDRYLTVTNTGLYSENYKAPIVFLEEVPKPSEILTKKAGFYEFL